MIAAYVPLWCKSNGSFLEGASHPEELVEEAHRLGLRAVAITDRDGVYGIVRAHEKARELGVQLLVGAQITIGHGGETEDTSLLVLLAQDRAGYANLCGLLSAGRLRSEKGSSLVTWSEVCERAPGLMALWGGDRSLLVEEDDSRAAAVAGPLREAFGDRLYALVARHRRAEEVQQEARLRERAARFAIPLVAGSEVLYHAVARRPLQEVLTCFRHGVTLHTARRLIKPNAEHDLKSLHTFAALFADDPVAVARTEEVAARCRFSLADLRYRYPLERLPDGKSASQHLRDLTFAGARKRYGGEVPANAVEQLEKELRLIEELDYGGYFLTMREIVEFCERQNILCQGRGSAANSVVCYCLGVTAIDPVHMGLLFERFLSRERAEPPDIDLDIEHERARGGDPARVREVRPRPRRHGGQRDPLPRALGHPRRGQGARHLRDQPGAHRAPDVARHAGGRGDPGGGRFLDGDDRASAQPVQRDPELPAPPVDPPGRLPPRARARSPRWCRSRTPPWRSAPSFNGTRTTWSRWDCSRSTCWDWARSPTCTAPST